MPALVGIAEESRSDEPGVDVAVSRKPVGFALVGQRTSQIADRIDL